MKKHWIILITLLTLMILSCQSALADGLIMKDPMEFSDHLTFYENTDSEYSYKRNYRVDSTEHAPDVVLAYLENLMQYEELTYAQCTVSPSGWVYHVFQPAEGYSYDNFYFYQKDTDWKTVDSVAIITYKPGNLNVYFYLSHDFTLWDQENEEPTATPKPTTLQLFGCLNEQGKKVAFDL